MVYFFTLYFVDDSTQSIAGQLDKPKAVSRHPYILSGDLIESLQQNFVRDDYAKDFKTLKSILFNIGCSIPTLYKQYCDLCEPGGVRFLGFGVDPAFGDCIDGLVLVDTHKIKEKKRQRYIPELPGALIEKTNKVRSTEKD